ncbi:hypothetical protein DEU56DRAFT_756347 [Suillus clintonianus]|uniref:uncharacterized protein n=1 Tax=Suillus clintonianus TaxID=1904413 RepID=UPI001B873CA9|nr:uncharacterized protein DEU56DRAFT_756347 [Suillus clintonianus]KAG2136442.1 hypothetical protein DEU56DRAFT_756347 [Suillus clintonianus]
MDGGAYDWNYFYVNMFVDRDMFMRYRGGGVGHKPIHEATRCLLNDRDALDQLPFMMEKEREAQSSDDEMADSVEGGDNEEDESEDGESEEDNAIDIEDSADEDGNEDEPGSGEDQDDEGDGTDDPLTTEHLIDDDIADEMDEFGWLVEMDEFGWLVLVEDEDDAPPDDDDLGAEDGEERELDYDEAEGIGFADL